MPGSPFGIRCHRKVTHTLQVRPHLQSKLCCNKPATASHKQTVFLTEAEERQRNRTSKERKMKLPEAAPEDAHLIAMVSLGTAG